MFEAFEPVRLVEKLPLKICAITTWGDHFLIATAGFRGDHHLLSYKLQPATDFNKLYEAKLLRTLKNFTPKQIVQLAAVAEFSLLIVLSADNEICCADLNDFQKNQSRIKGAVFFAVDWQRLKYNKQLRLCVAVKKKLVVYQYRRNYTLSSTHELPLPETAKAMAWVGDSLIVCIRKDLYHLTLDGDIKELFTIGSHRSEPCLHSIITSEGKGEILVLQDEKQICLDADAKPTQSSALVWSDHPMCVEHVHPYIIGLLPRGIEIRALEQKIQVQVIDQEKFRFVSHDEMTLVASQSQVYKLEPKGYDSQVQQLVIQKQFELALQVAELIKETEDEQRIRREEILRRYAFYLFTQYEFDKSLKYYLQIKEDPVNVIGLYPHLLPSDLRQTLTRPLPTQPPVLTGKDLTEGTKHLITYLTQMRYKWIQDHQRGEGDEMSPEETKKTDAKLQLIDTTLLKCYIKTGNHTLIGSLVRLPDNHLHVAESERVLRTEEKFQELVQLFRTKGQHRKALELLTQFHKGPKVALSGVWPTIEYLQNLGSDNLDLILSYSKWVLHENPDDGLRIFTEEIKEVENLPRQHVLVHLTKTASQQVVPYLEHIILRWSDPKPEFHNRLILEYKRTVEPKLLKYLQANKGRPRAKAGHEPEELGFLRSKLLNFLQTSQHYRASELISKFPSDELFEERALLLGRLGRHDVALAIYAHVLSDPQMAESYCKRTYDPENEDNKDVYLDLIRTYLTPTPLEENGIKLPPHRPQPKPSVEAAMAVLADHHEHIDTAKVMGLLPSSTLIHGIQKFLTTVLEEKTIARRRTHVIKSLYLAENMQVSRVRVREQSPHFIIHETTQCSICKKKMGMSAFARHPNGKLSHYYCYQREEREEEEADEETN